MFATPFSHKTIRSTILTFGAMFSNIHIQRQLQDGSIGQTIFVPITYGPKEKIMVRVDQAQDFDNQVMVTLPRMAFEIVDMRYDADRMVNRNKKVSARDGTTGATSSVYAPVPYNLSIRLYLLTKGTEDSLDVLEQILPNFSPEYIATIQTIPEMGINQDIPFVLNGISVEDDYEGDFSTRRLVTTTFDFTVKLELYGKQGSGSIITRTDTSVLGSASDTVPLAVHTSTGDPITGTITSDFWT